MGEKGRRSTSLQTSANLSYSKALSAVWLSMQCFWKGSCQWLEVRGWQSLRDDGTTISGCNMRQKSRSGLWWMLVGVWRARS